MAAIASSVALSLLLWFAIDRALPPLVGMEELAARMVVALKCAAIVTLFGVVLAVEAVAHERLQTNAFDPLQGHETKRLTINLRYLQNTLEQTVVFLVGLFGLAVYLDNGSAMRALPATTAVWLLNRFAFWLGYHRSAALRGLGAPSMAIGLIMLLYVAARIGADVAGSVGAAIVIFAFAAIEAVLFWKTR